MEQQVVHSYVREACSLRSIARTTKLSLRTVQRILKRNGVQVIERRYDTSKFSTVDAEALIDDYRRIGTARPLARKYGMSYATALRLLKKHGAVVTMGRPKRAAEPELIAEVGRLYRSGVSRIDLAARFHVRHETISNWLRFDGIDTRLKPGRKGTLGRFLRADGYVLVLMDASDPFFVAMARSGGYAFEHRLVMARHLGRPLFDSETVHHIDGNKANNKIGNLQLRFGRHGHGRVLRCGSCGSHDIRSAEIA